MDGVRNHSFTRDGQALEREFFVDNLLVRLHFNIEMIWWTGLAPLGFEFLFPYFTEMCSGSEAGSYLRLVERCITQL